MALSAAELMKIACDAIDGEAQQLARVSQALWEHPELAFQEKYAHDTLTAYLEERRFPVERHYLLDTAFRSVVDGGSGSGPNIAVCLEYDALPEIGHACGHNLIAEAGAGACVGVKAAMDAASKEGMKLGKLTVLGTPAEEGGGGKIEMERLKGFADVTCAMMVHPCSKDIQTFPTFARDRFQVRFRGRASHAASAPWEGKNALDALFIAYGNISCLRQQMKPDWKIHGVVTNGGKRPNIIPEETEMDYYIRTSSFNDLKSLREKAYACFEGAATATGCTVEFMSDGKPYAEVMTNWTVANVFTEHAESLGVVFDKSAKTLNTPYASTDMGNISYSLPSIHPMFNIGTKHANHTRDFNDVTGSPAAQDYTIVQAKAMAMTTIDLLCNPQIITDAQEEFKTSYAERGPLVYD